MIELLDRKTDLEVLLAPAARVEVRQVVRETASVTTVTTLEIRTGLRLEPQQNVTHLELRQAPASVVIERGVVGPQGRPGTDGDKFFEFVQYAVSAEWHIIHNLGKFPSVTVVDSGGNAVEGDVLYIDNNQLLVTFSAPFAGKAWCN
jgi:hypothetical protein